jgi:hypothetical protein
MATNINSDIQQPDAKDIDVTGGLDLKSDSATAAPPKTTRADNCWYITPGTVRPLPPFQTMLATLAQPPVHLYNLHARDAAEGASSGDIMMHGEYADAPGSATNGWTTPLWAHNMGQTLNTTQPILPYVARTRQLGASASPNVQTSWNTNSYDANANSPIMVTQDIAGLDGRRRYAMVCNGSASQSGVSGGRTNGVLVSFGYLDDGGEVVTPNLSPSALLTAGTFAYVQAIHLPNTQNWALCTLASGATSIVFTVYTFAGVSVGSSLSFGAYVAGPQPMDCFIYNNMAYCAYYDKQSSTTAWMANGFNLSTAQSIGQLIASSQTATPTQGLCAFSAQPNYTGVGPNWLAICCFAQITVMVITGTNSNVQYSTMTLTPPTAAATGGVGMFAGAAVAFDASNGIGAKAVVGFTLFRLFNENCTVGLSNNTVSLGLQSVAVDRYTYTATGNTLTLVGTTVFRTSSGATIACKPFATNPPQAQFAGPAAAKTVVCAVRTGSFEGSSNLSGYAVSLYGQPTYYLIDHQARIVGRWFDGAAPAGQMVQTLPTTAGTGIGPASISATMSDMSDLRVQIPSWSLIGTQYAAAANLSLTGSFVAPTNTPINPVFVPAVLDLQYQAQGVHVPPSRGGSHQYVSGPLTCLHDGRMLTEANYHTAATNPGLDPASYSASLGGSGYFYWSVVWTWIDALGRKHRSQPSLAASRNYGTTQFSGIGVIVTAPLGNKYTSGSFPVCEVYRTLSNATDGNSYLVATLVVPPMGTGITPNAGSIGTASDAVYTDSYTNATTGVYTVGTISAQPRMYTSINATNTANVYPAAAPPPFVWQVATKGRLFGLAYVQGEARLYYSSVDSFGIPLEWNQFNYATVPGEIGEARSVEAIDDKIVIFGTRGNAVMNGDGPPAANAAGIPAPGDGFSAVTPLPTPAGVLGTGSPVRVPTGILFQGAPGIQMIGRDLSLSPLGAPVDVLTGRQFGNPGTIFGRASLLPSLQSVVWANPAGPALVFNYVTQAWSTWPLLSYASTFVQRLNGDVWVALQPMTTSIPATSTLSLGADVGMLTVSTFAYNSPAPSSPALVLETPWLAIGATQAGEGWLREMSLYGDCIGPHILQIEQAFDYGNYVAPPTQYAVTNAALNYEYQLRPPSARARAVRYRMTLLPTTTLAAQYATGYISDLALFMGAKQGTARLGMGNSR